MFHWWTQPDSNRRLSYLNSVKSRGLLVWLYDFICIFISGLKRYILTAIDLNSSFAFAYTYTNTNLSSRSSTDFFHKLDKVSPVSIGRIQTDNGAEFHKLFREELEKKNITHFFAYPRRPQQNAKVERFNRTLQEEFINHHLQLLAYAIDEFNRKLMDYLLWYNTERPHYALSLQTPINYIINHYQSNMLRTYA